jgi:hypothetical protein
MDNPDDVYRLISEVRKARLRLVGLIARMETERTTSGYTTIPGALTSAVASGTSMMKTQPLPGILRISPPCALTAFRAIESPRPRPDRSLPRRSPNT